MIKKIASVFICIAMLLAFSAAGPANAKNDQDAAAPYRAAAEPAASREGAAATKSEVVYANLSASGAVEMINVVNVFTLEQAGIVVDFGRYTDAKNLTDTEPLTRTENSVSFAAQPGDFYYQGTLASDALPWVFSVTYELDGEKTDPVQLTGKSGALTIHIETRQNEAFDTAFYDAYMLQISLTLDAARCRNISAPGATEAIAGKDKVFSFTVMPGADAEISVTADVTSFSMIGIDIAAVPFSMSFDLGDLGEMTGGLITLSDAVGQFNSGMAQLKLGSATFRAGMGELGASGAALVEGSAQIKSAFDAIGALFGLGDIGEPDLSMLNDLPALMNELAATLQGVSGDISALQTSLQIVDGAISAIPEGSVSWADVESLASENPESATMLEALYTGYAAGQQAKSTYQTEKPTIDASMNSVVSLAAQLDSIATQILSLASLLQSALESGELAQMLEEFVGGVSQLSGAYGQFHSGLVAYTNGVAAAASGYDELDNGIAELSGGMGVFYSSVKQIPGQIELQLGEYESLLGGAEFEPVSFVSEQNNDNISAVQFVIKLAGIDVPEESETAASQPETPSLLDRFFALFKKDD